MVDIEEERIRSEKRDQFAGGREEKSNFDLPPSLHPLFLPLHIHAFNTTTTTMSLLFNIHTQMQLNGAVDKLLRDQEKDDDGSVKRRGEQKEMKTHLDRRERSFSLLYS